MDPFVPVPHPAAAAIKLRLFTGRPPLPPASPRMKTGSGCQGVAVVMLRATEVEVRQDPYFKKKDA
jgi:hypothetical protein